MGTRRRRARQDRRQDFAVTGRAGGACLVVPLLCALVACGCAGCDPNTVVLGPPDGCAVEAMRCAANKVEICGSDKRWVVSTDCDEVASLSGGTWICNETTDAGPACVRSDVDGGNE